MAKGPRTYIKVDRRFIASLKTYLKGERTIAEFVREAIEEKISKEGGKKLDVGTPIRKYSI